MIPGILFASIRIPMATIPLPRFLTTPAYGISRLFIIFWKRRIVSKKRGKEEKYNGQSDVQQHERR
jgi:hypothetical protein